MYVRLGEGLSRNCLSELRTDVSQKGTTGTVGPDTPQYTCLRGLIPTLFRVDSYGTVSSPPIYRYVRANERRRRRGTPKKAMPVESNRTIQELRRRVSRRAALPMYMYP